MIFPNSVIFSFSYLAAGRPLDAARSLARRVDLSALRAAVEITRLANEEVAFKAYGNKYIQQCQLHGDWLAAAEVLNMDPCFKVGSHRCNFCRISYFLVI